MPRDDWDSPEVGAEPQSFELIRTLDGHIGVNVETDPDLASDFDWRRNAHAARKVSDPRHRKG